MAVLINLQEIPGAAELNDWFGYWPTFHDAEIISLHLDRGDSCSLRVHTWEMTKEMDEKGCYVRAKNVVVDFVLEDVFGLTLTGFNQQNVIFGLSLEKIDSGFRLGLDECYGLAGSIEAKRVSIRVTPGKPS